MVDEKYIPYRDCVGVNCYGCGIGMDWVGCPGSDLKEEAESVWILALDSLIEPDDPIADALAEKEDKEAEEVAIKHLEKQEDSFFKVMVLTLLTIIGWKL
ncbi:MAG: hypothetical protein ACRCUJ_14220 [Phocaeicola sp.]